MSIVAVNANSPETSLTAGFAGATGLSLWSTSGGAAGSELAADAGGPSVYVAGMDLGLESVFLIKLMRESTSVEETTAPRTAMSLLPPHPNPMSDRTEIVFDLPPTGASVLLDVVDVTGRVVAKLSRGPLAGGRHQALWRRESSGAERVPAGVYFLRLDANGIHHSQKIVLQD